MTRKDYELIAGVLSDALDSFYADHNRGLLHNAPSMHGMVAESMADALAADNPRFDRERFLKACGVE
jgi:hypothetical protein